MSARRLEVLVNDELVGILREENDLWQFEYADAWIASARGFDLSPALSRNRRIIADGASNRPVQWYFDNLLPEEALRTVIAKDAGLNAEDGFGLLAYFGAESAGALVLRDAANPVPADSGVRPLSLEELNARILNLPNASLTKDAPKRMSLAGAQHKMLVILDGDALYEPLPATPSTHILKPNFQGGAYPASVMNEYFTMRLAKAVGLDVPTVHRRYAPQPVYMVDRFDRVVPKVAAGGLAMHAAEVQRRHVIDTCQLLNKARTFKYSAARLETLVEALTYCRSKIAARLQLYRWLVFNVLVGNGDNHIKNISFLVGADGIALAPAYDMLCTAVYDTKAMGGDSALWPHTELAFSIGEAKTFGDITREHLLTAGAGLGLSERTAIRELDDLLTALPREADKLIGLIQGFQDHSLANCPDPDTARYYFAGEMRMLRAARGIVFAEMAARLAG